MSILSSDEFAKVYYECDGDITLIQSQLRDLGAAEPTIRPGKLRQRISNLQRKGVLPLESGNSVEPATILKSVSTSYDALGNIKSQRITSHVPKDDFISAFHEAIIEIASQTPVQPVVSSPQQILDSDLTTLYISNDIHFGELMWDKESGRDWNVELATQTVQAAYDHLFNSTPNSKYGVIVDLGDLLAVDDFKSMTPKSGNIIPTDSRFPKIVEASIQAMKYAIEKALQKHEIVYFYNIAGNHDISSGVWLRATIAHMFSSNPRVIVDSSPMNIKYHHFGQTLIGFAHGDGLKMRKAGEVMACDKGSLFSQTKHRFFHFGHTHQDSVYDSTICRCESHRNLAPLNHWAYDNGYRTNGNTMKAITYHSELGEVSRNIFNIS